MGPSRLATSGFRAPDPLESGRVRRVLVPGVVPTRSSPLATGPWPLGGNWRYRPWQGGREVAPADAKPLVETRLLPMRQGFGAQVWARILGSLADAVPRARRV